MVEIKKHHVRNGAVVAAISSATTFLTELGSNVAGVAGTDPGSEISLVQLGVAVVTTVVAVFQHQSIQSEAVDQQAADANQRLLDDIAALRADVERSAKSD